MKCELCNLEKRTRWYYEDDKWIIADCTSCRGILAVYKMHTLKVPIEDLLVIFRIIKRLFGDVLIRTKMRNIRVHFHFHIYKK